MASKNIKKITEYLEKIVNEPLEHIVSERFARYSKYIIQDRALPDARDGLKPVQRRILFAMNELGMQHNKPYKKSARIAGEVMGKYHPHGDSSIYDAMVRMSQDFKMLVPLIDMHGNNGSIDGDSAAAMRYTEARLSLAAEYLLKDIDKKTVPFVPNFDDEELEPTVLPSKFPNILVNGSKGISAGYATNIPPHNLNEVVNATIAFLDDEEISDSKLISYIKGPDFPTGGIVQGKEGIKEALKTGSGKIIIRARTFIEEMARNQERIVITEIPYELNKAELVRSIDMLRVDKKIDDILEVRDETDQQGMRIAIELKKGADANFILNYLYKSTDLQISYNYNMTAILNRRPYQVGVKPLLKAYIDHQKEVITNRSNFELDKAKKREHIVEGLIKMVSVLEEIIKIIRKSSNKADSKENIQKRFGFTDLQAEAIVTLQLYRLSNTDILALQAEAGELAKKIRFLNEILSDERVLKEVIKEELQFSKEKLGQKRKTTIEDEIESIKIDERDLISDENVIIGVTKDGYVKRSSLRSYQASQTIGLKTDDGLIFHREISNLDTLLIFTNLGNYIYVPVYKIDDQRWRDLGVYIGNIVPVEASERIISVINVREFNEDINLLLATKNGYMKQTKLKDFEVSRYSKAIRGMRLQKDDELVSVNMNQKENIIGLSKQGYALRFKTADLPEYGSSAGGVQGMMISDDDELVEAFYAFDSDDFVMLTVRGHIIKDNVSELTVYSRNRKGIRIVENLKSNPHYIVSAARLSKYQEKENVKSLLTSTKQTYEVTVSEYKYSYNKYGKKMFDENVEKGYKIFIEDAIDEVPVVIKKKPEKIIFDEINAVVEEEKIINKNKKIHLSRLDLFEDD
ncbi:DNA topoisomerase IV subunit A [Haploplasma axanthum]|uniref:DNA topoisomerase 4 subunit A n=1 Tax=Haploplasma axanthum TaxID=29552 RepID=A0A449BEX8_HAPAX|nr:DNA topoisomerase IV subunit A [Haploplasma axanthum]VEU80860.1 DNA gyrase, A subunit [Haploplasma axanthum]